MKKVLEFKPRKEEDLIIGKGEGSLVLKADSLKAKNTIIKTLIGMHNKNQEIKEKSYTCGDCAAYPCFRTGSSRLFIERGPFVERMFEINPHLEPQFKRRAKQEASRRAGLCYQKVRQCRQECDYFLQDKESGGAPDFQITGTCKRDNSFVNYNAECRFLN